MATPDENRDFWVPRIESHIAEYDTWNAIGREGKVERHKLQGKLDPHVTEAQINIETGNTFDPETNNNGVAIGLGQITGAGREMALWNDAGAWQTGKNQYVFPGDLFNGDQNLDVMTYGMLYRLAEAEDADKPNADDQILLATEYYGVARNAEGIPDGRKPPGAPADAPTQQEYYDNIVNYITKHYGANAVKEAQKRDTWTDNIIPDGIEGAVLQIGHYAVIGGVVLGIVLVGGILSYAIISAAGHA